VRLLHRLGPLANMAAVRTFDAVSNSALSDSVPPSEVIIMIRNSSNISKKVNLSSYLTN
jgi:hypothetical protein